MLDVVLKSDVALQSADHQLARGHSAYIGQHFCWHGAVGGAAPCAAITRHAGLQCNAYRQP